MVVRDTACGKDGERGDCRRRRSPRNLSDLITNERRGGNVSLGAVDPRVDPLTTTTSEEEPIALRERKISTHVRRVRDFSAHILFPTNLFN